MPGVNSCCGGRLKSFVDSDPVRAPSFHFSAWTAVIVVALLASAGAKPAPNYVKIDARSDGLGAQASPKLISICAIHFSPNWVYLHEPFASIEHGQTSHAAAWDAYLALGDGFPLLQDFGALAATTMSVDSCANALPTVNRSSTSTPTLFTLSSTLCVLEETRMNDCYAWQRARFASLNRWEFEDVPRPAPLACSSPPCITVAMHVRRGDVGHNGGGRWTSDEWYNGVRAAIVQCLPHVHFEFHVFSEGLPDLFENFTKPVDLHLSDHPAVSFEHLTHADVMVMGSSSFSVTAAMMHQGSAVVTNGGHRPVRGWEHAKPSSWVEASHETPRNVSEAINCWKLMAHIR